MQVIMKSVPDGQCGNVEATCMVWTLRVWYMVCRPLGIEHMQHQFITFVARLPYGFLDADQRAKNLRKIQ